MRTSLIALAAGLLTALAVSGMPASAADAPVAAQPDNTWNPKDVTIAVGDSVTWSNPGAGGYHNICVAKPGHDPAAGCDEFRNGDAAFSWAGNPTNAHSFGTAGTYRFICEIHASSGMTGTVTVNPPASGTTTTNTETITNTTPAEPAPTTTAPGPDRTAPSFTGKLKRKASRTALIVELGSSEAGKLGVTVFRRPPHGHAFSRVGQASLTVKVGRNTLTLPRMAAGKVRSGAYRVKLMLEDGAGNRSGTRTLTFKLA